MTEVTILGASAAGCTLALFLRNSGCQVDIYESRSDIRLERAQIYRSICISLSHRGLRVLDSFGLGDSVRRLGVPVQGRVIHSSGKTSHTQPYGSRNEALYCTSRIELNKLLLDEAERAGARLHFDHRCVAIDPLQPSATFTDSEDSQPHTVRSGLIIGADGPFSVVRKSLAQSGLLVADSSEFHVGYREASLPPTPKGDWALDPGHLHVWPMSGGFLIAFPLVDRSFACMLFLPVTGDGALADDRAAKQYLTRETPQLLALAPDIAQQFFERPLGKLPQLRCFPWTCEGSVALVGDAAHTMVPFCGQGMNATFEDCEAFCDSVREHHHTNLSRALAQYQDQRKPNADAIDELSREHFSYLSDATATESIRHQEILAALERDHPEFVPLYTLIEFSSIPYSRCREIGGLQRALVDRLISLETSGVSWRSEEGRALVVAALREIEQLTSSPRRS